MYTVLREVKTETNVNRAFFATIVVQLCVIMYMAAVV